jgi:DNA-binding beta-propeller fold protein YncE
VRPRRTIAGDRTGLDRPVAAAVDARGALYVANAGNNSVTAYAPGAAGNVAPERKLRGPPTGLTAPAGLTLDARGRLYIANAGRHRLTVYQRPSSFPVLPSRRVDRDLSANLAARESL